MNTHLITALHRMGYSKKPELTPELMSCPKAQINECMRLQKTLIENNIIHSTMAIETDLAWEHIKNLTAGFPKIFNYPFHSFEQLAWSSAIEIDKEKPGTFAHFKQQVEAGNWKLSLCAQWDSVWNLGGKGKQHSDEKITRLMQDAAPMFKQFILMNLGGGGLFEQIAHLKRLVRDDPVARGNPKPFFHVVLLFWNQNDAWREYYASYKAELDKWDGYELLKQLGFPT